MKIIRVFFVNLNLEKSLVRLRLIPLNEEKKLKINDDDDNDEKNNKKNYDRRDKHQNKLKLNHNVRINKARNERKQDHQQH